VVIGLIGERGSGVSEVLSVAARSLPPSQGLVTGEVTAVPYTLDCLDAVERARKAREFEDHRRAGAVVLLGSHDEQLLASLCDEVWWFDGGRLAMKGDPAEVLAAYRTHVAQRLRAAGENSSAKLDPRLRRGDGRAELVSVETLGENGAPTMVWRSGERASVRIRVRFRSDVQDPVIGMMIRTRIGFEVYGTNTELERVTVGPCRAGDVREVVFEFNCELCPQEYTITAASHDPDGVWHDWLEDAIAFSVADNRYTAGVANLRAAVTVNEG
jgi:lipopolysaccharide transport system ATP-binding protein